MLEGERAVIHATAVTEDVQKPIYSEAISKGYIACVNGAEAREFGVCCRCSPQAPCRVKVTEVVEAQDRGGGPCASRKCFSQSDTFTLERDARGSESQLFHYT